MSFLEKKFNMPGMEVPEQKHIPQMPPVHHVLEDHKPASISITIPVAEYVYLQRVDALMDTLLVADNFNNSQVIASIKNAVLAMRNPGEGGADQ